MMVFNSKAECVILDFWEFRINYICGLSILNKLNYRSLLLAKVTIHIDNDVAIEWRSCKFKLQKY